MARLYDLARIIRSKNAGPFIVTLDVIFDSIECLEEAYSSLTRRSIAEAYKLPLDSVLSIIKYEPALALKINLKRQTPSGHPGDRDVYGSQQHMPLALMELDVKCGREV